MSRIDLTAVIPIRRMDESTAKLKLVILDALKSGIEVILVVNHQDASKREIVIESHKANQHEKFRILESEIESPGLARNLGLSSCNTSYLTFWDADDLPVISEVCKLARKVQGDSKRKFGVGSFEIIDSETNSVLSRNLLTSRNKLEREISRNPGIWRWIFNVQRIGNVRFKDFPMGEDQDFIADLNPIGSEVLISADVTYKYFKGWKNQLTRNKFAVGTLTSSIRYLVTKIADQSANDWHKKFLLRQVLTAIKRGSWRNRIEVLQIVSRVISKNAY